MIVNHPGMTLAFYGFLQVAPSAPEREFTENSMEQDSRLSPFLHVFW